jgi:outer membrane protein TolC
MRHVRTLLLAALSASSVTAFAQTQTLPVTNPNPQALNLPPPPPVDDPDLRPLPPAKRTVASWDEITSYLRARSADIRVALDEVGRAQAQRREAVAGVLGTINATGAYTHNFLTATSGYNPALMTSCTPGTPGCSVTSTIPAPDYVSGSIVGALPLIAPQAWVGIHIADVNIDVQKTSLEDIKRTIATSVANAAIAVVTAEHVADLNRVGLRQSLESLELAKRKTSLGAGTGLDIVRAQQNVENARTTLVTGDESAREAREAFGISIGVAEDVSVAGDLSFEAITKQVMTQCKPSPNVEQRTDVIAAREKLHYARVNVWSINTQFFPILTLQSTLASTSLSYANPKTTWNMQAVLTWAIWDGGVRYGQMRDYNLQVLEAQDRLDAALRNAIIQVVQADRGVQVAEDTRAVSLRARDLASEVDRLTRAGFMTGLYTSLDLVTSSAALRQAEINLALADYGLVKAKVLKVLALATCPV